MARYKQNLLPDEMDDIPPGAEMTPWINPNDNIVVIGTPEGPRYIRNNAADIYNPQPMLFYDKADLPTYKNSFFNPTEPPPVPREPMTRRIQVNPEDYSFNEMQDIGRRLPPGPPPPINYATNIPDTANRWAREGKLPGDNFDFLTNTPEETTEAKQKGFGKWGKIIGPPEAAITPKKAKEPAPYPGPPPDEEQIQGYKDFSKFWNTHVREAYGGNDPLKNNPAEARKAAEQPLKDDNAQFIYDYETYGAKQMGADATARYNRLQKQIKEAGDLAEKQANNAYHMATRDQSTALQFFKEKNKAAAGLDKLSDVDKQELISLRQEKTSLSAEVRKFPEGVEYFTSQREAALDRLRAVQAREDAILKKAGTAPPQRRGGTPGGSKGGAAPPNPLSGKPAGRYRVNGRVISWDGSQELQ